MRLVRDAVSGEAVVDPTGHAQGRGAYLHRDRECVELARRRGALARALKATAGEAVWRRLLELAAPK